MKIIAVVLIVFLSTSNIGWPGPFNAERAYYDGVYDTCMFAGVTLGLTQIEANMQCQILVRMARQGDWYHNPPIKQGKEKLTRPVIEATWK